MISTPAQIHKSGEELSKWNKLLYGWGICQPLKMIAFLHKELCEEKGIEIDWGIFLIKKDALAKCKNIVSYSDLYHLKTRPEFETSAEYYKSFDCYDDFKNIDIPTLIIHSKNDPCTPYEWYPWEDLKKKSNIISVLTPKGSHLAYLTTRKAIRVFVFFISGIKGPCLSF